MQIKQYVLQRVSNYHLPNTKSNSNHQDLPLEEVRAHHEQVLEKAIKEPDSALMMIDPLRMSGTLPDYQCDFLQVRVYAQTLEGTRFDS